MLYRLFRITIPDNALITSTWNHCYRILNVKLFMSSLMLLLLALADDASAAKEHPLFQRDTVLKAVLTAPITQTYAQRHQDVRIYFPGQWTYVDADSMTQRLDVSIRTRGNFRREYCDLPPLQLNFKKKQVKGTLFAGQNKLKIVSPCQNTPRYQQYVVLEYLAYRTLEILTDHSFKTRLLRLSYVDSDEKIEPWTATVFVIEDDADMAKRLGLQRLRVTSNKFSQLDQPKTALAELFQLLIANSDYSVLKGPEGEFCCHNSEVLAAEDTESGRIPVPFDFDMSGLVNAFYASPPEHLPITDVRFRFYKGLCQPREILNNAIAHMRSKRDEIIALYVNSIELEEKTKAKTLDFINRFFAIIDSPKRIERELFGRCRGQQLLDAMSESSKDST